ncbi:hypothetical protein FB451DRAFT_1201818 [Mycena latifolia]|nr:hypothetical protein FB451DRAFT_1201818 [Mycena latifolia]
MFISLQPSCPPTKNIPADSHDSSDDFESLFVPVGSSRVIPLSPYVAPARVPLSFQLHPVATYILRRPSVPIPTLPGGSANLAIAGSRSGGLGRTWQNLGAAKMSRRPGTRTGGRPAEKILEDNFTRLEKTDNKHLTDPAKCPGAPHDVRQRAHLHLMQKGNITASSGSILPDVGIPAEAVSSTSAPATKKRKGAHATLDGFVDHALTKVHLGV